MDLTKEILDFIIFELLPTKVNKIINMLQNNDLSDLAMEYGQSEGYFRTWEQEVTAVLYGLKKNFDEIVSAAQRSSASRLMLTCPRTKNDALNAFNEGCDLKKYVLYKPQMIAFGEEYQIFMGKKKICSKRPKATNITLNIGKILRWIQWKPIGHVFSLQELCVSTVKNTWYQPDVKKVIMPVDVHIPPHMMFSFS